MLLSYLEDLRTQVARLAVARQEEAVMVDATTSGGARGASRGAGGSSSGSNTLRTGPSFPLLVNFPLPRADHTHTHMLHDDPPGRPEEADELVVQRATLVHLGSRTTTTTHHSKKNNHDHGCPRIPDTAIGDIRQVQSIMRALGVFLYDSEFAGQLDVKHDHLLPFANGVLDMQELCLRPGRARRSLCTPPLPG